MSTKILYSTEAQALGGRDGTSATLDGTFEVKLSTPNELGGDGRQGNNPEQLFAAGYAACFLGAMKFVTSHDEELKVKLPETTTVNAIVGIGPRSEGGFGLDVKLNVSIPDLDRDHAAQIVEQAHQVCPYSNATRGALDITPILVS